jgi:hypothetical protein
MDDGTGREASISEPTDAPRYAIQLAPGTSAQIDALPEWVRERVRARLQQLAIRAQTPVAPMVRGRMVATDFDALYEVDNELRTVTVLDVTTPA